MIIRPLEERDRERYLQMSADFYSSPAVLSDIPQSFRENAFEEFLRGIYSRCFILEEDGKSVGYGVICFYYSQEAGGLCTVLDELYVEEAYRSRGFGRQYFDFIFTNFPSPRFILDVEPDNLRARSLYEKLGFKLSKYLRMSKGEKIIIKKN